MIWFIYRSLLGSIKWNLFTDRVVFLSRWYLQLSVLKNKFIFLRVLDWIIWTWLSLSSSLSLIFKRQCAQIVCSVILRVLKLQFTQFSLFSFEFNIKFMSFFQMRNNTISFSFHRSDTSTLYPIFFKRTDFWPTKSQCKKNCCDRLR